MEETFLKSPCLAKFCVRASVSLMIWTVVPVAEARADILASIAHCESHGQQFDEDGQVLRNSSNHIGVFQFSERLHAYAARQLGYNIYTLEGNWAYARYVFRTEGTAPWLASRSCWGGGHYTARHNNRYASHNHRVASR